MGMRTFLKTGRARYWGRPSRPGQPRTSRGKIWGAGRGHRVAAPKIDDSSSPLVERVASRESSKTEKTCQQVQGRKGYPRYRLLCETRGLLPRTPLYYYYVVICSLIREVFTTERDRYPSNE